MMKKTTILLVMVLAIAFLGFAVLGFGLPKDQKAAGSTATPAPPPAQKQPVATQAPRLQPVYYDDATADINRTTPQVGSYRGIGAQRLVTAGVPYVLVSTGHPETAGGNSHMRRQVKSSASGVVHMVYRVFDADTANVVQTTADSNRNGFYFYNAYDCGNSNALRNGRLDVPMQQVFGGADARPRKLQLGGLVVPPGGNVPAVYGGNFILREDLVQAGRYDGSPQTVGVMKDGAECSGLFSMDTTQTNTETRLNHPVLHAVNESTYIMCCYRTNFPNLGRIWRTTNRGLTWTGPTSTPLTAAAWYGSWEMTGSGNNVYLLSMTDPNDLTAFVTTERPVYIKITYNPATGIFSGIGNPAIDIGALSGYSNPAFLGCMTDIAGTMVGETLHVAWMTWNNWLGQQIAGPGGEVLHAQVFPDGSSPSVDKIADVNIDGRLPKISTTLFGFASLPWSQIELSYNTSNSRLYCLWVQPPPDANPNDANYDWGDYEATGTLAVDDIFMSVSPNNGRGWDDPTNVTQTNNPGCDGSVGDECQHEYWFSCDDRTNNDTIYTVALVNKYPGIQEAAIASGITPDVGPQTAYRDEFRLYKVPARAPVLTARGAIGPAIGDTVQPYNLKLTPGSLTPYTAHMRLRNIGLLGFITDSIRLGADLNSGGLATTTNFSAGNPVAVGGGYNFNVSFDASLVTPAQAGAHSGLVQVFGHSTGPTSNVVVGQAFNAYLIPTLCLNRKMQIHSASNQTDIGSQGTIKDAGGVGMAYPAIPNRDNFYDGGVWVANSALNAAEGVPGVPRKVTRQLFADKFLRCLSDIELDSTLAPGGSYNLSLASISTDVEDSTLVFKNIWEQSTHADSSDFLIHTVKVINIGSSPIDSVAMGNTYDIDVASDISSPAGNVSGDTSVSYLGRKFWIGWVAGNDVAIDTCSPNSEMYGVVIIPGNIGNPGDSIHPHGAVMYDQAGFSYNTDNANEGGGDSLCQRYMWNVNFCTSTRRRTHDTLTGVWQDTTQPPPYFVCDADSALGAPYRGDEGYMAVAKKVYNLAVNTGGGALVARYGLGGLVAGTDSAFKGVGETYSVLHLASNSGMADLLLNAQKAIDWYVKHANQQAGSYQDVSLRGDFNNDHAMTPADAVISLNKYLAGVDPSPAVGPFSQCVADVNLDGNVTPADIVNVLNRVYLGLPNCPWCLTRCP